MSDSGARKYPNISNQFKISINGSESYIMGTGYNMELKTLKEILQKKPGFYRVGSLFVSRIATICNGVLCDDDDYKKGRVIKDDVEIDMEIEKEGIFNIEDKVNKIGNDNLLLLFLTFKMNHGKIDGFTIKEMFTMNNFPNYEEIFKMEIQLMKDVWEAQLFSTQKMNFVGDENGFKKIDFEDAPEEEAKPTPKPTPTSSVKTSFGTPRESFNNSANTDSRKRKGPEVNPTFLKKERTVEGGLNVSLTSTSTMSQESKENYSRSRLELETLINILEIMLDQSTVAVTYGGERVVQMSTLRTFLGVDQLEIIEQLLKLSDNMPEDFRQQTFDEIRRLMRCRKRLNDENFKVTRIIKICEFFNIPIPSYLNYSELENKYKEINEFYVKYVKSSNPLSVSNYDEFRQFIEFSINNNSFNDSIVNDNVINATEIMIRSNSETLNTQDDIVIENEINTDNCFFVDDDHNIDIESTIQGELEVINEQSNLNSRSQEIDKEDHLNLYNSEIDEEDEINLYNSEIDECNCRINIEESNIQFDFDNFEIDNNSVISDEFDYNEIYDCYENSVDESITGNINGHVDSNNDTNLDNDTTLVPLNSENFDIDHIIRNTYGHSEELDRSIRNNEMSNLLMEQDDNENDNNHLINENNEANEDESSNKKSLSKREKKKNEYKENLEKDFIEYNFMNYFNQKRDKELRMIESVLDESIELAEKMRNYDINVPNIPEFPKTASNRRKDSARYNYVRSETLFQSRFIGINIFKNAPIPFTQDNSNYVEDSCGYLNRLFGGYRYHLYKSGQNIKDFELIYIIFSVVSRIFRSVSQYSNSISYYNEVLNNLLTVIPKEKRKEDIKQLINNVISSNIRRHQNINSNIFVPDEESIMNDIRDGYELPLQEMTLEQQQLVKYTTLARCCDEECQFNNPTNYLSDILAIFIAFQRKDNKIKTIYKIIKYMEDNKIFTYLNKLGKCFSRIRGLVMRIKEIKYQLEWLVRFNRNKGDPELLNFKGFSALLKSIVVDREPMHSNEINLDQHREVIRKVRDEILNIKLRMCILCERVNVSNMKVLKKDKKIHRRIMNIINTRDDSVDHSTIESASDIYSKIDLNHPFLNKEEVYLCNDCYNGSMEKNLRNNPLGITKYSVRNGLYCDKIPDVVKNLNQFEKLILQKRWIVQSIFAISNVTPIARSQMNCITGYSISIKVNSQKAFEDLLAFGKRYIIIINKSEYRLRTKNLVDLQKTYEAYKWFIDNNPLYKDDVIPLSIEDFDTNFVQPQFAFIDDVSFRRQNIVNNMKPNMKKKIVRKANKDLSSDDIANGVDPYDNETIFKFDHYIQHSEFESFLLESSHDEDENFDPIAVFTKQHLKINWKDSELDMSKKMYETFPYVFPYARFGLDYPRRIPLTSKEYLKTLMSKAQRRFSKECQLIMALSKTEQKKDAVNCIRMIGNMKIGDTMTIEDSLAASREGKLMRIFRKIKISDSYWHDVTNKLNVIETYIGSPTWFLTLNPSEHQWDELISAYKLLHVDQNKSFNLKRSVEEDPYILNIIFEKRLEIILEHLKSTDSVLGRVVFYYYKIEYQQRGTPHVHLLLWTDEGMELDYNDKEKIVEFIDKYITTSLYTSSNDVEFTEQILAQQKHVCKLHYCKKRRVIKKKNTNSNSVECYTTGCRFGFPKQPSYKTKILKMSDDVESLLQFSNKTQKTYILRRMENETEINQYNPHIKMIWLGNVDLQPNALNFSNIGAVNYVSKYVSKSTLSNNEQVTEYLNTAMKSNNKSVSSKLFHLMYGMHLRPQAYTELIDIARSANSHYTSLAVVNINTSGSEDRTRHLYKDGNTDNIKAAENMYDNYYFARPPLLEEACLFSFFANFSPRRITATCKVKLKDDFNYNTLLLSFDELDNNLKEKYFSGHSTDRYGNIYNYVTRNWHKRHISSPCFEFSREISYPIGTTMEELENSKIHLVPQKITLLDFFKHMSVIEEGHEYPNEEVEQDIYARYCRLFVPRRKEISPSNDDCKKIFCDYMNYLKRNHIQTYDDIIILIEICNSYVKKRLASKEFSLYKKELHDRYKEILDFDGSNFQRLEARNDGFVDPVKKFKDRADLENSISMLNNQQYLIYDLLYRKCIERYNATNDNVLFAPTRIICDGPGGTGKSFLINVLAASVTLTIRSTMITSEAKNQPFILKVTPTGVASVNISGRTIHSLFCLPVSKSKLKMKLKPLNMSEKSRLSGALKNVQLLIIDEISMVDASMLYSINYRINEALNCDSGTIFGNLNCLFTGDLLQLPPVKNTLRDAQMFYEEIDPIKFEAQFKSTFKPRSAFINFNFIPLIENNRQRIDLDYAEALNDIRKGNITENLISIVNSRTFKDLSVIDLYFRALDDGHLDPVILTPRNKQVDFINDQVVTEYARRNNKDLFIVYCNDVATMKKDAYQRYWLRKENQITQPPLLDVTLDSLEELLIVYEKKSKRNESGLNEKLLLCKGSIVMIKRNLDLDKSICNGARGIIEDIIFKPGFNKENKIKASDISEIKIRLYETRRLISISPSWHYFICGKSLMRRLQLPIQLAYCTTVHKSQGLTLSAAVIHFPKDENDKISKTPGLLYVALSRIKHSNSLYIKELDIESYNLPNEKSIITLEKWSTLNPTDMISYTPYEETEEKKTDDNKTIDHIP
uniref:ATP-dependent DNA helicase n=1 Tax=Strongyloides papillosus TaxID=174720 RepID=A0A0N5BJP9_STREA